MFKEAVGWFILFFTFIGGIGVACLLIVFLVYWFSTFFKCKGWKPKNRSVS